MTQPQYRHMTYLQASSKGIHIGSTLSNIQATQHAFWIAPYFLSLDHRNIPKPPICVIPPVPPVHFKLDLLTNVHTNFHTNFHTMPVKSAANSLDRLHAPTTEPTAPWMCLEWLAHCCSIQLVGKQWWVHVVNRIQFADISTSWSWYGDGIVMVISCSWYCMILQILNIALRKPRMVIWVLDAVVMAASFGAGFKLVQALLILGILEEWPGSGKSESLKLLNQYGTCIYYKLYIHIYIYIG